ncbi:MAG TPA: SAM-dependent methyltransferase [Rhizomicrobium sp.]|nr:SAM-dependent methyltransferase [Rhizomicrobium sp.]
MNPLGKKIARLIEAQGPIPVSQFLMLALHDRDHGVYASRNAIGREGDFTTAPEISQMFGELLGLWLLEVWRQQGAPKKIRLVELGPGRGTLMRDVLRAARLDSTFLAALEIVLVEASPTLKEVQAQVLKDAPAPVRWATTVGAVLDGPPLYLLANEFFDALPLRQFVKTDSGWHERMVVADGDTLAFALAPMALPGLAVPEARGPAEIGAIYEVSPASTALAEDIAAHIAGQGGAALIVDYGYAGGGFGETLQAIAKHTFAPILDAPGTADLSAHVDFAALGDAVRRGGAQSFGPIGQGALLEALGITQRTAALAAKNPAQQASIQAAFQRLTAADQMGVLFKALAILPPTAPPPPGF